MFRYTLECISEKVGNYLLEFICAACYYLLMVLLEADGHDQRFGLVR